MQSKANWKKYVSYWRTPFTISLISATSIISLYIVYIFFYKWSTPFNMSVDSVHNVEDVINIITLLFIITVIAYVKIILYLFIFIDFIVILWTQLATTCNLLIKQKTMVYSFFSIPSSHTFKMASPFLQSPHARACPIPTRTMVDFYTL